MTIKLSTAAEVADSIIDLLPDGMYPLEAIASLIIADRRTVAQALLEACPSYRSDRPIECDWIYDWIRANGLLLKEEE